VLGKSTVVFAGTTLSLVLGLALQIYLASRLGVSSVADVFYLGSAFPALFAVAILSSSSNGLIRTVVERPGSMAIGVKRTPARSLMACGLGGTATIALLGVLLLVSGNDGILGNSGGGQLGSFLLAVSLVPILVTLAAIGAVTALSKEKMLRATWGYAVNGIGLLATVVLLSGGKPTTMILALGINVGYLCQLALVWPHLRWHSDSPPLESTAAKLATKGVLILFLASLLYKSQPLTERTVGAVLGDGVPATLGYVDKVTQGFTQMAVFGFAVASLPLLSRHMTLGDGHRASLSLGKSVAGTAVVTVLICAITIATAGGVITLLYGRGEFDQSDVLVATQLLRISVLSIFFGALAAPLVASLYASNQITAVVWIGLQGFLISLGSTLLLAWVFGTDGIVLGTACGFAFTFFRFAYRVQSHLDFWSWGVWSHRFGKYAAGAAIGAFVGAVAALVIPWPAPATGAGEAGVIAARVAVVTSGWLIGLYLGMKTSEDLLLEEEPALGVP